MTRDEAIEVLKNSIWYYPPDVTSDEYDDRTDVYIAAEMAIEALKQQPQSDPETGLMPCGCGGVPEYQIQTARFQHEVSVGCPKCFASSAHAIAQHDQPVEGLKMIARENWNTAMGWKGGAE